MTCKTIASKACCAVPLPSKAVRAVAPLIYQNAGYIYVSTAKLTSRERERKSCPNETKWLTHIMPTRKQHS